MNERRLKVVRLVIGLNQGGVQQGVLNLFRGLDRERFEPIAVAIENTGAIGKEIEQAGIEVITLGYKRQAFKTIWALVGLFRERQIDIVHASSYHPSLYGRIAGLLAGVPVLIGYEHVVFDNRRPFRVLLNRLLQPFTAGFTTVGQVVADQVCEWYGYPADKVKVIHNGVDTRRFCPAASRLDAKRALGLDPDRLMVGMICRLDQEKGHRFFFDAIKVLSSTYNVQWLVVGTGRGEQQIRKEAAERGVDSLVQFLGLRRDVPELLKAFDIYVLPSLKEGFPNSLLEAMAAGCAVVTSDFPGNLEVANHEQNALVVPMEDSPSLTSAIDSLLRSSRLRDRLSLAARRHVESEFSLEAYQQNMSHYYESLWISRGLSS